MRIWNPKPALKTFAVAAFIGLFAGVAYLFLKNTNLEEIEIKRVEESLVEDGEPIRGLTSSDEKVVFESRVFEARIQFNAIALNWKEGKAVPDDVRQVFLRTSVDGVSWEDWMELESLGPLRDDEPRPGRAFPEVPLLVNGKFFQYKVVVAKGAPNAPSPYLPDLRATYIDSRTPASKKIIGKLKDFFSFAATADQGPSIISRKAWGSPDPNGTLFKGEQYWDPSYVPVTQIFLHHTVFNDTSDPAAAVRAIWEYHAYTRGWGDIGYNYLVDQQGKIYEGRFGGDNVTAGHVYTFNSGSVGVAVLGCFETASSACAGAPPPSPQMLGGLTTLLAWKSANYEVNPNTTQTFCGTSSCLNLWTISGHKDASVTACPGNLVYDQLQSIREQTWNKTSTFDLSAKQLDFNLVSFSAFGEEKAVTLRFKNTGNTAWSNTTNRLLLKTANPDGRTSILQGAGWVDAQTPAVLTEASVAPGEVGTFNFKLKSPADANGHYWESFRLVSEGSASLNQFFTLILQAPSYRWEFLGVGHSTSSVYMNTGETQTITLWAKNVGTATWTRDDSWPVRLGTWGPSRASSFYHSGWFNNIRPTLLNQASVAPGEVGTFTFNVSAPVPQGWYFERFNLVAEGLTWFNDPGAGAYFNVLPANYEWSFLGVGHSTSSVFMNPGETQTITLKAKNTGDTTWYRDSSWPVRLGTWGPSRSSLFQSGSWLNSIRPAKLLEESVAPGGTGTFVFTVFVSPAAAPGWYFERFNLVAEGLVWFNDPGAGAYFNVLPASYEWSFLGVGHSTSSVFMNPGETQTITLWAKNTGTTTWTKSESWPVRLGTWGPSRPSAFYHGSWFNSIRPALLNQTSIAPGEVGTFNFTILAPSQKGWHFERINLVAEGLKWFNDTGAGFYIYVP